jgi:outer membrane protein TolC
MRTLMHRQPHCAGQVGAVLLTAAALTGCATVNLDDSITRANQETQAFTGGKLALAHTSEQQQTRVQAADTLLKQPLTQDAAVQLALVNSPALQALLAQSWADTASAAQLGRIANPVFTFERVNAGDELDIGRMLAFGLLDVLTLPQRYRAAQSNIKLAQLRLATDVVDHVTQVRQAWVNAVAAQQQLRYARQVVQSAHASAELARRMQQAGNFNRLNQARQQVFYADAMTQLATAQHTAASTQEMLIRLLGLTEAQRAALKLPERLADLPKVPLQPNEVSNTAQSSRLDVRIAQNAASAAARAQGMNVFTSLVDIELGIVRNTVFDNAEGTRTTGRGYEVEVRLPLFDWGGMRRDAMNARTLAAANQLESIARTAGSHLRESYSAYRTAYDIAAHYRDEIIPLRKTISDENLLRYNGMLIGVFELLADHRAQVASVMAAISAQQQFWLADAALQASMIGTPTAANVNSKSTAADTGQAPH